MDYLEIRGKDIFYEGRKIDPEYARAILTERANELEESLDRLRECTRIGRDVLDLEVVV